MWNNSDTEVDQVVELKKVSQSELNVVLYNDDINTFDYVIDTLIEVCDHDAIQAEQCAYLVHFKGRCDVKRGSFNELRPIRNELSNRGLKATIE